MSNLKHVWISIVSIYVLIFLCAECGRIGFRGFRWRPIKSIHLPTIKPLLLKPYMSAYDSYNLPRRAGRLPTPWSSYLDSTAHRIAYQRNTNSIINNGFRLDGSSFRTLETNNSKQKLATYLTNIISDNHIPSVGNSNNNLSGITLANDLSREPLINFNNDRTTVVQSCSITNSFINISTMIATILTYRALI